MFNTGDLVCLSALCPKPIAGIILNLSIDAWGEEVASVLFADDRVQTIRTQWLNAVDGDVKDLGDYAVGVIYDIP